MSLFFTDHIYFYFTPHTHLFWNFLVFSILFCLNVRSLSSSFSSFYLLFCLLRRHFLLLLHLVLTSEFCPFLLYFSPFIFVALPSSLLLYLHSLQPLAALHPHYPPPRRCPSLIFGFLWFFRYSMTTITIFIHFLLFMV